MRLSKEKGFSLIELVVVVAVLSVLSAIAIPAFNCFRRRAISTAAQVSIQQIKTECESNFQDGINTFLPRTLNSYSIYPVDNYECQGETIALIPDSNLYPLYFYSFENGEVTFKFRGKSGTSLNECNKLICDDLVKEINLNQDFVVKDSYLEKECFAYVLVDGPTWSVAEANAIKLGGHLATIPDAKDDKWIFSNFEGGIWIGLVKREGNWEWINGDKVDYKNWYPGQPSNSTHPTNETNQSYGWIHSNWSGKWDDHFDSNDVGTAATHGIAQIPICD